MRPPSTEGRGEKTFRGTGGMQRASSTRERRAAVCCTPFVCTVCVCFDRMCVVERFMRGKVVVVCCGVVVLQYCVELVVRWKAISHINTRTPSHYQHISYTRCVYSLTRILLPETTSHIPLVRTVHSPLVVFGVFACSLFAGSLKRCGRAQ